MAVAFIGRPTMGADNAPTLQHIVDRLVSIDKTIRLVDVETETSTSIIQVGTGKLLDLPVVTHFHCWSDGLSPSKFRLEYDPLVVPATGGGRSFGTIRKSVACDGKVSAVLVEEITSAPRGQLADPPGSGDTAFDPIHSGIAFVLLSVFVPNSTNNVIERMADIQPIRQSDGLWECEFDPVLLNPSKFPQLATIPLPTGPQKSTFGSNKRLKVWFDAQYGFAVKRIENWRIKRPDGKPDQLTARSEIADFAKVRGAELFFPSDILREYYVDGSVERRDRILVKSVVVNGPMPKDGFSLTFPTGTLVTDNRLHQTFVVGKDPASVVNDIKREAKDKEE